MKKFFTGFILSLFVGIVLSSCASREKIYQYQNIEKFNNSELLNFSSTLQPDDLLMIIVSAKDPLTAMPFNLYISAREPGIQEMSQQLYLVDSRGFIDFPVLGRLKVSDKTKENFVEELKLKLKQFIEEPIVNVRIMNYRVTVKGEVTRPGVYTIPSERITITEALALSGDLTIYSDRKNVLVVREINGKRTSGIVDLSQSDFINSPFYYLKQNDIVVVQPNKTKVNSSAVGPNVSTILTGTSILISLLIAIFR